MQFIRFRHVSHIERFLIAYPPRNISELFGLIRRGFRKNYYGYWSKTYPRPASPSTGEPT